MKNDNVNHPAHYTSGAHECIDVIKGILSPEEYAGFLKGNIIKYRFRAELKNGPEDIKKAEWYEERLLQLKGMKDSRKNAAPDFQNAEKLRCEYDHGLDSV